MAVSRITRNMSRMNRMVSGQGDKATVVYPTGNTDSWDGMEFVEVHWTFGSTDPDDTSFECASSLTFPI